VVLLHNSTTFVNCLTNPFGYVIINIMMIGRYKRSETLVTKPEMFAHLSKEEKLAIRRTSADLFDYELSKIPKHELIVQEVRDAEKTATEHYTREGFKVFSSKINGGYRCIGSEFYWKEFKGRMVGENASIIAALKFALSPEEFEDLAMAVKSKAGTPDLLLLKDKKISFVEVKCNNEVVKDSTVDFFIKYGDKWNISILRVCESGKHTPKRPQVKKGLNSEEIRSRLL